jgi:hypothetical protein
VWQRGRPGAAGQATTRPGRHVAAGADPGPAVDSRIGLLPAERWRGCLAIAAGRWDAELLLENGGVG